MVRQALLVLVVVLAVGGAGWSVDGGPAPPEGRPLIRLQAGTFEPGSAAASVSGPRRREPSGAVDTWLVQFRGPVRPEWKEAVTATGARLLAYVPDFAFKVRMSAAQARVVRALPEVAWTGGFRAEWKLSPRLRRDGRQLYVVRLERDAAGTGASSALEAAGGQVLSRQDRTLVMVAEGRQLDALARLRDVAWIEPYVLRKKHNEYGGGQIMGAQLAWGGGYDGSTQTLAVADTGLGGGTPATAHVGIAPGRVAGIFNWPGVSDACFATIVDDGAVDVDTGHGTHTSGSALSAGDAAGKGRGTAPGASLVFQAIENYAVTSFLCELLGLPSGYYLTGLPTDLRQLFLQAWDAGARVHSNSWGSDVAGQYTADSANADDFVWSHRELALLFSAGNAGVDGNADGGVDGWSMGSPATAKNVIAVGASENDRASDYECDAGVYGVCGAQGGQNILFTYGQTWPFEFPAEPLKSDPSAGNPEQMAAFSSRGPTDDGRIKPDLVAPGTWVLSAFSDLYQEGYDPTANPQTGLYQYDGWGFPTGDQWKYMGGTSMSTPLVAGGAAVVRDFYQKLHGHAASAALVKATLVNSAVDLLDENNDGVNDNAVAIPNFFEGWGRVDLAGATDGDRLFRDEDQGLETAEQTSVAYDVAAGTPFKVTLAWTDFPGTQAAFRKLVNDLELEVTSPDGALYRGNVFGRGWSIPSGLADRVNNLENVYVEAPDAGTWTVSVRGYNVPMGPQPFALVVSGQVSEAGTVDEPPQVTLTHPLAGAVLQGAVTVTADATDDVGVSQVEFFAAGVSLGVDTAAPWAAPWDTATAAAGLQLVRAVATDTTGQVAEDEVEVTVVDAPPVVALTSPPDGALVSGVVPVTATASDDRGVSQVEFFAAGLSLGVDSVPPWEVAWDSTVFANGQVPIRAVATDSGGQTAEALVTVTVQNVLPPVSAHVADLDGETAPGRRQWTVQVTITVHNDVGQPVEAAAVSGTWTFRRLNGRVRRVAVTCFTAADGQCSLLRKARNGVPDMAWEVTSVEAAGLAYDAAANTDPDGDSDGTTITILAP